MIAVISSHVLGWPRGGFAGVDVFFVVSGFLITGLLLRELADTGRISLPEFFARRVRRILPAALLVLVTVTAAGFVVFNRARADETLWDAVAAALFASNWRFAGEGTDYFSEAAVSPLQHFWSLSVEEQFYLVWPVLLLLSVLLLPAAARRGAGSRLVVGAAAAIVGAASWWWATEQTAAEPTVAYFSTATRAWELAVGALLAVAAPVFARLPAFVRWPLQWTGLAAVVGSFFVIDPASPFPAPWALLPVVATALVVAGGVGGDPRQRHLFPLTNPVSVLVGDASYGLYLWHFPLVVFAAVVLPAGDASRGIILFATVVLAFSTYYGLEQPLHRSPLLRRRAPRESAGIEAEPAPPAPVLVAPVPRASSLSTRPPGWVPGQRYYPGQHRRPPDAASRGLGAASPPDGGQPPPAPTPEPVPVPTPAPAPSREEPAAATLRTPPAAPSTSWTLWRARFRAQIGMSAAGLGIGAIVVVLLMQTAFGAPVLGPLVPPAASPAAPAEDPAGDLQAALAEALSATTWPELHPSLDEVMAASSGANPSHDCFAPDVPIDPERCTWGSADAPRHMYLVGDSTAMSYAPALKKLAEDSAGTWRVTTVGLYGCRFTDVLVQNPDAAVMAACPQRKLDVRAMIAAQPADLVIVSNAYTLGRTVDGRDLSAVDLLAATRAEMATYGAPGRVVYLSPPPQGGDLARCYSPVTAPANCVTAVDQTWRDMHAAAEATASADGDVAISSLPFTCWQDACPAFAGGVPVRYDATHLTVAYAERIAPALAWDLAALGRL